jgi:hypothetical protein
LLLFLTMVIFICVAKIAEVVSSDATRRDCLPSLLIPSRGSTSLQFVRKGSSDPLKVDNRVDKQDNGIRYNGMK